MQIPPAVLRVVSAIPERPSGTIVLRFGLQVPRWIVEYEQIRQFALPEQALRHIKEVSDLYPQAAPALTKKNEIWRVTYMMREGIS